MILSPRMEMGRLPRCGSTIDGLLSIGDKTIRVEEKS